jgi:hypothetical protein
MSQLSPTELTHLRSGHPHKINYRLSIINPDVVYCGTITGSPDRGAIEITLSNYSGDITDVIEGQTIWVGTSCSDYSITRRRLRSVDGNVITLDENSINWQNGWYVTILNYWDLWPKFPYISGSSGNYIFFKDRDVAYDDQNYYPPPVAIAGSHVAGYMTGSSIVYNLDASDSYAIAPSATISSYLWECEGAVVNNSMYSGATVTFTSAGIYWVFLTVTDSNGKSQTTRRLYRIHDVSDPPYYDFEFDSALNGSWDSGGWDGSIVIHEDAKISDIPDGALIIAWLDEYYDTTNIHIGDNSVLFIGYIVRGSVTKELDTGYVRFEIVTIHEKLKNSNMYSVSLTAISGVPDTWNNYRQELTVARAVHHYWKYHSTLFGVCDVILPVSNTLTIVAQDFDQNSLYAAINKFVMDNGIFAHVCCSKSGCVYVEQDILILPDADRSAKTVVMEIGEIDRKADSDLELVFSDDDVYLTIVSGTDSSKNPYISQAPGEIPELFGTRTLVFDQLILEDQDHANLLSGRLYAVANADITEVRLNFSGNYHDVVDIVPQEWLTLSLAVSDTKRGIVWTSKKLILRSIALFPNVANGLIDVGCTFEIDVDSEDGVAIDYPTEEPLIYPNLTMPSIPPWQPNWNLDFSLDFPDLNLDEYPYVPQSDFFIRNGFKSETDSMYIYTIFDELVKALTNEISSSPTITEIGTYAGLSAPVSSSNYVYYVDGSTVYRSDYSGTVESVAVAGVYDSIVLISDDIVCVLSGTTTINIIVVDFSDLSATTVYGISGGGALSYVGGLVVTIVQEKFILTIPTLRTIGGSVTSIMYWMYNYTDDAYYGLIDASIVNCSSSELLAEPVILNGNDLIMAWNTVCDSSNVVTIHTLSIIQKTYTEYIHSVASKEVITHGLVPDYASGSVLLALEEIGYIGGVDYYAYNVYGTLEIYSPPIPGAFWGTGAILLDIPAYLDGDIVGLVFTVSGTVSGKYVTLMNSDEITYFNLWGDTSTLLSDGIWAVPTTGQTPAELTALEDFVDSYFGANNGLIYTMYDPTGEAAAWAGYKYGAHAGNTVTLGSYYWVLYGQQPDGVYGYRLYSPGGSISDPLKDSPIAVLPSLLSKDTGSYSTSMGEVAGDIESVPSDVLSTTIGDPTVGEKFGTIGERLCGSVGSDDGRIWTFDNGNLIGTRVGDGNIRTITTGISDSGDIWVFCHGDRFIIYAGTTVYVVKDL